MRGDVPAGQWQMQVTPLAHHNLCESATAHSEAELGCGRYLKHPCVLNRLLQAECARFRSRHGRTREARLGGAHWRRSCSCCVVCSTACSSSGGSSTCGARTACVLLASATRSHCIVTSAMNAVQPRKLRMHMLVPLQIQSTPSRRSLLDRHTTYSCIIITSSQSHMACPSPAPDCGAGPAVLYPDSD